MDVFNFRSQRLVGQESYLQTLAKHREKERYRHRGLNAMIENLANRVPGFDGYPFYKTKVVKLHLVIDYIRTLEEAVDGMCSQLGVSVASKYSFLSKNSSNITKKNSKKLGSMSTRFNNYYHVNEEDEEGEDYNGLDGDLISRIVGCSDSNVEKRERLNHSYDDVNSCHYYAHNHHKSHYNASFYNTGNQLANGNDSGIGSQGVSHKKIVVKRINYKLNEAVRDVESIDVDMKMKVEAYADVILNLKHSEEGGGGVDDCNNVMMIENNFKDVLTEYGEDKILKTEILTINGSKADEGSSCGSDGLVGREGSSADNVSSSFEN